jgi:hypothetical protein
MRLFMRRVMQQRRRRAMISIWHWLIVLLFVVLVFLGVRFLIRRMGS